MGYGYSVHVKAKEVMQQRRAKALREADYRLQEIYNKIPGIEEIDRKLSSLGSAAARAVVKGGDVKQHIEELKVQSLGLQEERKCSLQSTATALIMMNRDLSAIYVLTQELLKKTEFPSSVTV